MGIHGKSSATRVHSRDRLRPLKVGELLFGTVFHCCFSCVVVEHSPVPNYSSKRMIPLPAVARLYGNQGRIMFGLLLTLGAVPADSVLAQSAWGRQSRGLRGTTGASSVVETVGSECLPEGSRRQTNSGRLVTLTKLSDEVFRQEQICLLGRPRASRFAGTPEPRPECCISVGGTMAKRTCPDLMSDRRFHCERQLDVWLPQTADVYFDWQGHCVHRQHSDYLLFSIDDKQQVADPAKEKPPSNSPTTSNRGAN
jgi:hypothetical protein